MDDKNHRSDCRQHRDGQVVQSADNRRKISSVEDEENRAENEPTWYTANHIDETRAGATTADRLATTR